MLLGWDQGSIQAPSLQPHEANLVSLKIDGSQAAVLREGLCERLSAAWQVCRSIKKSACLRARVSHLGLLQVQGGDGAVLLERLCQGLAMVCRPVSAQAAAVGGRRFF